MGDSQAAMEWIAKRARDFPRNDDETVKPQQQDVAKCNPSRE